MSNNNKLILGKFAAPHGVRGWIKVISFTDPSTNLLDYTHLFLSRTDSGPWSSFEVLEGRPYQQFLCIKIKGVDDRDQAAMLTNQLIATDKAELAELPQGDYYWSDLVGLSVVNKENLVLGTVTEVFSNGANDILAVDGAKAFGRHLIPYLTHVILSVDLATNTIQVDWTPGDYL